MKPKQIWDDTRGATLLEFTVTLPFFLLLTFGLIQAAMLLYTQSGLQHGVEGVQNALQFRIVPVDPTFDRLQFR